MPQLTRKFQASVQYLREALDYDPESGKLIWKVRPDHHGRNRRSIAKIRSFANKEAFTAVQTRGYNCGIIGGVQYLKHRVVWAIHTGEWPPEDMVIDHIDGDRKNNRISNLRCVTQKENVSSAFERRRGRSEARKVDKRNLADR